MLDSERVKLWGLIEATPNLDWLLLTKRPENIANMMPIRWGTDPYLRIFDDTSLMPVNVWVGTSVENQEQAEKRIPYLLAVPAKVRFLSCEPLLGPADLTDASLYTRIGGAISYLNWVIVGGESGPGARPMHPDWARGLRDQCQANGVPFLFKQWGQWAPIHDLRCNEPGIAGREWYTFDPDTSVCSVGKHAAGRVLDGRTWDQLPTVHGFGITS